MASLRSWRIDAGRPPQTVLLPTATEKAAFEPRLMSLDAIATTSTVIPGMIREAPLFDIENTTKLPLRDFLGADGLLPFFLWLTLGTQALSGWMTVEEDTSALMMMQVTDFSISNEALSRCFVELMRLEKAGEISLDNLLFVFYAWATTQNLPTLSDY
jgi:hypothetical protein